MMLTTGMSIFGKMSVGVRTIASPPRMKIRIANTAMVYGRLSASLTIHISRVSVPRSGASRTAFVRSPLRPVPGSLAVQSRDHLLGRRGHSDRSGENNVPCGNVLAVDTSVIAIVWTNCGTLEGHSGKQTTRSCVAQDFGTKGGIGLGRRVAANRPGRHGSVASQFDLAGENPPRATLVHNQQDQIRSLPADLKAKAAALQSHHVGTAPCSPEILTPPQPHSPPTPTPPTLCTNLFNHTQN